MPEEASQAPVHVALLNMPAVGIARPSIALGILKSILHQDGLRARILNFNLKFAARVGLESYRLLFRDYSSLLGEWIFAEAAHDPPYPDVDAYLRRAARKLGGSPRHLLDFQDRCRALRAQARPFILEAAQQALETGARVIGATSSFQQHLASLAVLRQIKQIEPTVVTLLGGANCEGVMGVATSKIAPWIDVVVSGEAEDVIVDLARRALTSAPDFCGLPDFVITQRSTHRLPGDPPAVGKSARFATAPSPDYDDYFTELGDSALRQAVLPALPVEASRGCWWGEKLHCTFCGLNGETMAYRAKAPEHILDEWGQLTDRYGPLPLAAVDNIFAMAWFKTLLPRMEERGFRGEVFFEIKANLSRQQVDQLARSGITHVQPGIETLSSPILRLMGKGCTAHQNVQLLRWCAAAGVRVQWGFLHGFPGEPIDEYERMAGLVPLLTHLQPPIGFFPVEFHRFSVYHQDPQWADMKLQPAWPYPFLYPHDVARLTDLAYIFEPLSPKPCATVEDTATLSARIGEWIEAHSGPPPHPTFNLSAAGETMEIIDRRLRPRFTKYAVRGAPARLLLSCDSAPTADQAHSFGNAELGMTEQEVLAQFTEFEELGLVARIDQRYVLLPTLGTPRPLSRRRSPYGTVLFSGAS